MFVWEDTEIMKIKILIPVYNDWQSASKLIDEINSLSIDLKFQISIIIVNDVQIMIVTTIRKIIKIFNLLRF